MGSRDSPFNEPGTEFTTIDDADTDAGDQRESPASDAFSGSPDVASSEDQTGPLALSKGASSRSFMARSTTRGLVRRVSIDEVGSSSNVEQLLVRSGVPELSSSRVVAFAAELRAARRGSSPTKRPTSSSSAVHPDSFEVLELQAPALPEGAIAPSQTRTELLRYSPPPLPSLLSLTDLHDDIDGISALDSSAEEPPRGDGSPACPASARWIPSESPEEIAPDEILKLNIADSDVAHEPGATSLAWTSKEMNGDGAPSDESRSAVERQHADRDESGAVEDGVQVDHVATRCGMALLARFCFSFDTSFKRSESANEGAATRYSSGRSVLPSPSPSPSPSSSPSALATGSELDDKRSEPMLPTETVAILDRLECLVSRMELMALRTSEQMQWVSSQVTRGGLPFVDDSRPGTRDDVALSADVSRPGTALSGATLAHRSSFLDLPIGSQAQPDPREVLDADLISKFEGWGFRTS